jgi:predicted RNase H-like HicB family nuclease
MHLLKYRRNYTNRNYIAPLWARGTITRMKSIIQFNIWQEDGRYLAAAGGLPIATDGATVEELKENIRDVVATYFHGDDPQVILALQAK